MNKILSISDSVLFVFIMLVSLFGLALLYSATNQDVDIVIRQGSRLLFCFILMIIVSSIEINKLKQLTPYIYIICLIFLAITLFWGHDSIVGELTIANISPFFVFISIDDPA